MDTVHMAETHDKIREAHREHLSDSMSAIDLLIHRLFELEEYISDFDNPVNDREYYLESVSSTIEFLHSVKEGARSSV